MDFIHFAYPERIHLIWLVIFITGCCGFLMYRFSNRVERFLSHEMQARLMTRTSVGRQIAKLVLMGLFGVMCVLGLMRPYVVGTESNASLKTAANIYVLLDVSKSMLATDVMPSRLDRAKSEIRDMLPAFSEHRVGLMAFAGRATVLSPLTADHGFFRLTLDSASPASVTLGGTNIGEAIAKAVKMLSKQEGAKTILLISDGEAHDNYAVEAAKDAKRDGVRIVTVGFGSESGSTIDIMDKATGQKKRLLDSNNQPVISKLNGEMLRQIALETDGAYVPAGNGVLDLESIIKRGILPVVEENDASPTREVRVELFQWFLAFALVFLAMMMVLESGARQKKSVIKEEVG